MFTALHEPLILLSLVCSHLFETVILGLGLGLGLHTGKQQMQQTELTPPVDGVKTLLRTEEGRRRLSAVVMEQ